MKHREKLISKTLSSMKTNVFAKIEAKYQEECCVICVVDFTSTSKVSVTNECEHIFHTV